MATSAYKKPSSSAVCVIISKRKHSFQTAAPGAEPGEEVLLQGVVDCWFVEADGSVTVLDFKTDRVTADTLPARAESYRPQLDAYTRALAAVTDRPVARRALWFFSAARAVEL